MPLLSKPSSAAYMSLAYITTGALLDVWTGIWLVYLQRHPPGSDITMYWCYGLLLTGLTLIVIGFAVGQIGRSARHAELPPPEVTAAAAMAEQNAAARAPVVAPLNSAAPVVPPNAAVPQVVPAPGSPPIPGMAPVAAVAQAAPLAQRG